MLVAPKANGGVAATLFAIATLGVGALEGHPYRWWIFAATIVLGCLVEYSLLRIRVADQP